MVNREKRYDLQSVKNDLKSFFQDNSHRAYKYGSKTIFCNKDSIFYKKQLQIIFEDVYPHDVTGKAVNELIKEGLLKEERHTFGKNNDVPINFVYKKDRRYVSREIKDRIKIVEKYSDDELNDGCGKYAELLLNHMFETSQFKIIDRNTRTYKGKSWKRSKKDLDFIIAKDECVYGVEVKNTFDYMPQYEFQEKVDMCEFLGILPLFPVRFASPQQLEIMEQVGGLLLIFKTRIFPPGNQKLVTEIWNNFRLPVNVWYTMSNPVKSNFVSFHIRTRENKK